jgi:hypothetical protein
VNAVYVSNGMAGREDVTAPLAVYRHSEVYPSKRDRLIVIQHASYLIADIKSQPYIDRGEAVLYRGIQNAEVFSVPPADNRGCPLAVNERSRPDVGRLGRLVQRRTLQCIEDRNGIVQ